MCAGGVPVDGCLWWMLEKSAFCECLENVLKVVPLVDAESGMKGVSFDGCLWRVLGKSVMGCALP